MRPVVGTVRSQLAAVLSNCAEFDRVAFATWLLTQNEAVRRTADRYPPDRLYRCTLDWRKKSIVYGYIEAYTPAGHVVVMPMAAPPIGAMTLPYEALEDVTEDAQLGKLPIV